MNITTAYRYAARHEVVLDVSPLDYDDDSDVGRDVTVTDVAVTHPNSVYGC